MMSAVAMVLAAAMVAPRDGLERAAGEIEQSPPPLDLRVVWVAVVYRSGETLEPEASAANGQLRFSMQFGGGKSVSLAGEVDDEGKGNLRLCRCLGIYEQVGNRLRICLSLSDLKRPPSFQPGDREYLLILHRVKSTK